MTTAALSYAEERVIDWQRVVPAVALAGLVLYGLAQIVPPLAALIYLLLYVHLAWQAPALALMLILAVSPFSYDVSPGMVRFSLAELNLAICGGVLLLKHQQGLRTFRLGPLYAPVLIYLAICVLAGVVNPLGKETLKVLVQMVLYLFVAVAVFASMVDEPRQLLAGFYAMLVTGCVLAGATFIDGAYAAGMHKNAVGASLAGVLVVAVELWFAADTRRAKYLLTPVVIAVGVALMFSLSRGAWVGGALGIGMIILMRRQFRTLLVLATVSAPAIAWAWSTLPEGAQTYAFNLEATAHNSVGERYENAAKFWALFKESPIFGQGTGYRKLVDATNIVLSTLAETGVVGLIAFAAIFWRFTRMVWWAQRRVARTDPLYSLLAIAAGLMFARLGHGMFDHYWSRGALTAAWSAAGMATLAYLIISNRVREGAR